MLALVETVSSKAAVAQMATHSTIKLAAVRLISMKEGRQRWWLRIMANR